MDIVDEILADRQAGTRRLVAEYANRLNETAVRLCGNVTDAEDYVFRTLERAVSRIHTFSRKCALSTWLYEILVNIIRDDARLKAANALTFTDNLPEIEDMRPDAGAALTEREEASFVRAAVRELPDAYRALVLRLAADLAKPVTGRINERQLQEQAYADMLAQAKLNDAREQNVPYDAYGENHYVMAMKGSGDRSQGIGVRG